eukprot:CAMPEP_0198503190 /NCGR_PEP_ID=MMETSP1462-20131121/9753_1 /TAXON_ID=1333877 /ORGANISM="Brandtodinium nutriculum, Strain RCC3387" /LENGTH=115 /DNA_ID=CAMNT_0044232299 /DNA_START=116 /DNA_END=460 /DNA_ORIENTATION=+
MRTGAFGAPWMAHAGSAAIHEERAQCTRRDVTFPGCASKLWSKTQERACDSRLNAEPQAQTNDMQRAATYEASKRACPRTRAGWARHPHCKFGHDVLAPRVVAWSPAKKCRTARL